MRECAIVPPGEARSDLDATHYGRRFGRGMTECAERSSRRLKCYTLGSGRSDYTPCFLIVLCVVSIYTVPGFSFPFLCFSFTTSNLGRCLRQAQMCKTPRLEAAPYPFCRPLTEFKSKTKKREATDSFLSLKFPVSVSHNQANEPSTSLNTRASTKASSNTLFFL
ncbi:hypothetical protein PsorP6_000684 [Peronosclerospora sorghi]|uniref:Uncharacterized protein n=1 Tax=Peronosclerospora sorghi TaxID=230839 RepID=A0ACC0WXA8_9STRA|nr:hypothetical protein PsorP6_000684 [Peronosclerospora sorghi]